MANKTVTWCSTELLECIGVSSAGVIVCLQDAALVANGTVVDDVQCAFLDAIICAVFQSSFCPNKYTYTFQYDDEQLADPDRVILTGDITGAFCKNCLTDWIFCQSQSSVCVEDSTSIDFSITDAGCVTGEVLISNGDGNILMNNGDGLYVPCCSCVTDSNSIDFSLLNGCVTGDVLISEDADNALSLHADGLYAAAGSGGSGWLLTGNAGTVDGTNFLGTTDDVAFTIRQNNEQCIKILSGGGATFQNYLGGANGNTITGSANTQINFLGWGAHNKITSCYASAICCGDSNWITDTLNVDPLAAFIGAGDVNRIDSESASGIVCGEGNSIQGNGVSNFIGAGNANNVDKQFAACICSGDSNEIISTLFSQSITSFIGAGVANSIDSEESSAIVAGEENSITGGGVSSFIGAGSLNNIISDASNDNMSILGGEQNVITTSNRAVILGGHKNFLTNADHSSILGGGQLTLGANSVGFQADPGINTQRDPSAFSNIAYFGDVDIWVANTNSTAMKVKFFEPNATLNFSTTNYSSFAAQAQAANIDYIWPAAAGTPGQVLTIDTVVGTVVTLKWA